MRQRLRGWRAWAAPCGVASLPAIIAAIQGLRASWIPMGDDAYFAIRARDVLTAHHPLVGAWSSGSEAVGIDVNNLGPLQLDLLALPLRVFGFGPGTIIGVTAVNVFAAVVVVVVAGRRLGSVGRWAGAAAVVGLSWALGSELLIEPRQHHFLILPFFACIVLAWSLLDGDHALLPWAAFFGTLVVQTHFSFLLPVLALGLLAVAGLAVHRWRRAHAVPGRPPDRFRRHVLVTGAVLVVLWVQPVIQQLHDDQGNLSAVLAVARADQTPLGGEDGARMVATIASPLGWLPPSFGLFRPPGTLYSTGFSVLVLLATGVGLVLGAVLAWRRRDRATVAALVTAAAVLVAMWWSAASTPVSGPFGVMYNSFRPLWPVGAFVTSALVLGLVRAVPRRRQLAALGGVVALMGVLVAVRLPDDYQLPSASPTRCCGLRPSFNDEYLVLTHSLRHQMAGAELEGPVIVDRIGVFVGEPYSYVVIAALQDRGIEFVFDYYRDVRRFGEGRRHDGAVTGTLVVRAGQDALEAPPGSRRLASASWLTPDELDELATLTQAAAEAPLTPEDEVHRADLQIRFDRGTVAVWFVAASDAVG